jgi:lantibiotic biosynthesis protein
VNVGEGITWFTPPERLLSRNRKQSPFGYYNLGVAHGVPGVIALLAGACRAGIRPEVAHPLLTGAVRWVMSQRLSESRGGRYPAWIAPGHESRPCRLAWCYGGPGVAATLLYAAKVLCHEEWEAAAMDIATHAARATPEESGVEDAGLCHGAFGLAHLYNRIYQASGDESFADASRMVALLASRLGTSSRTCNWAGPQIPGS